MSMNWQDFIAVLGTLIGLLGVFYLFINTRLNDLKELFKSELRSELRPINEKLDNHITDTTKEIQTIKEEIKYIKEEMKDHSREIISKIESLKKA